MAPIDFFQQGNVEYIEQLHQAYLNDPNSVGPDWALFFAGFEAGYSESPPAAEAEPAASDGEAIRAASGADSSAVSPSMELLSAEVQDLVHSYRELGHFAAKLDPLARHRPPHPLLELSEFGLSDADLDRQVGAGNFLGPTDGTLRSLVEQLQATYCGSLGVEYMDIADKEQREWLQQRMEPILNRPTFSAEEADGILSHLITAETFETFLQTKYLGQKRFSCEGAEALIPLLETVIELGAELNIDEMVMGMPHRGRLNVLAHVLHKPYEIILSEFEGTVPWQTSLGDGDVKYHLGFSHDRTTATGRHVHCALSYNPSHLELVDPVIQGIVRAKQQNKRDEAHSRVMPILIHGEAAFTGQGIVPETLNLSELKAYRTGGTIHVIINNQVGFTATAEQTRFTPYPTDVARMIQAPIFHVNGDDPEAVVHAARLAIAFRQKFKVDVLIDLWCYRRRGHNESDDPTFTQPRMYELIAKHPTVVQLYTQQLLDRGVLQPDEAEQAAAVVRQRLTEAMGLARQRHPQQKIHTLGGLWKGLTRAGRDWSAETAIDPDVIQHVTERYIHPPEGFAAHSKLQRVFTSRSEMAAGKKLVDWGCAEMWSLGSLLLEGTPVRLVGQDTERGTFTHRHAVMHDVHDDKRYVPLKHLAKDQATFTIVNTMLSELAVLGFEYGFSSADPHTLVIWEAQFGDFVNGAQPVIDQFLVSAESKWLRMSGLVLLLPHGYEGQGPEHSSARLERFLQLCGDENIQVCYPTQSAQLFHLLRRQMRRNFRKPLIVMSPKSLLREERAGSPLEAFTHAGFQLLIDDPKRPDAKQVRRLLLCSGRVFFPLDTARNERQVNSVAIARVEQLYPLPAREIQTILARYSNLQEVCWVQEEPRNMGAWSFMEPRLRELLPQDCPLSYIGRDEAASPATGLHHMHEAEEKALIDGALDVAQAGDDEAVPRTSSAVA
jgi:2-oxoglutarate dehydrogenase E1 component